jgi:hypothetical protein
VAGLPLRTVQVVGQILGDEAVEQHPEDVGLEIPAIDGATQVVGDAPDGLVEFGALGVAGIGHVAGVTSVGEMEGGRMLLPATDREQVWGHPFQFWP